MTNRKNESSIYTSGMEGFSLIEDDMIWNGFLDACKDKKVGDNPNSEIFQRRMYKSYQKYFLMEKKKPTCQTRGFPFKMRSLESVRDRFNKHIGSEIVKFVTVMEENPKDVRKSEEEYYRDCLRRFQDKHGHEFRYNLRKYYFEIFENIDSLISSSISSRTESVSTPRDEEEFFADEEVDVCKTNQVASHCGIFPDTFLVSRDIYDSASKFAYSIYSGNIFSGKRRGKSKRRRRRIPKSRNFTTEEYLDHLYKKEENSFFLQGAIEDESRGNKNQVEGENCSLPPINFILAKAGDSSVSQLTTPREDEELFTRRSIHLDDSMYHPDEEDDLFVIGDCSKFHSSSCDDSLEVSYNHVPRSKGDKPNNNQTVQYFFDPREQPQRRMERSFASYYPRQLLFGSLCLFTLFCITCGIVLLEKPWKVENQPSRVNSQQMSQTDNTDELISRTPTGDADKKEIEDISDFIIAHTPNIVGTLDRRRVRKSISHLKKLDFTGKDINGPLPSSIGALTQLTELRMVNSRLRGIIPTELGRLSMLQSLDLSNNAITGTLPIELGTLTELRLFNVANNKLSGTLPDSQYMYLQLMEQFDVSNNHFEGTLPLLWSNWNELELLSLQDNYWSPRSRLPQTPYGENLQFIDLDKMAQNSIPDSYCTDLPFLNAIRVSCPVRETSAGFFLLVEFLPCGCCIC